MNLPEKFQIVNKNTGILVDVAKVSVFKYHAAWKIGEKQVEDFIDTERFETDVKNGVYHIVERGPEKLEGAALRSRTTAEFLDYMTKTTAPLTAAVCNSIAQAIVTISKAMYGKKPS